MLYAHRCDTQVAEVRDLVSGGQEWKIPTDMDLYQLMMVPPSKKPFGNMRICWIDSYVIKL